MGSLLPRVDIICGLNRFRVWIGTRHWLIRFMSIWTRRFTLDPIGTISVAILGMKRKVENMNLNRQLASVPSQNYATFQTASLRRVCTVNYH